VRSVAPRISTSHGASVSTHTVAWPAPTWRSSGPMTSPALSAR
jgi:DsbC/DsbD-like thiol-disulfide interchange protein